MGETNGEGGPDPEVAARVARLEAAVGRLIDAVATAAPHLPVMVSLEVGALAEEARALLVDGSIDLTAPGE